MDNNRLMRIMFYCGLMLASASCALSPQTIQISPLIGAGPTAPANNTQLAVEVRDSRQSEVIGYRGGVYDTASISTAGDIAASLQSEITRVYRDLGFQIAERGAASDARLVITVEQLNYTARQDKLLWTIEVSAIINAEAITGSRTTSNKIEDRLSKEFPKSPSVAQNANLINDVISRVLERIVQDPAMLSALRTRVQ